MGEILLLALVSAANPTLLAAVIVMLFAPNARPLLSWYLCGALLVSVPIGVLLVFVLRDDGAARAARDGIAPSMEIVLGGILLLLARLIASRGALKVAPGDAEDGVDEEAERRSRVDRLLARGSGRISFGLGVVLTLPSVTYLAALRTLRELDYTVAGKVAVILGFNVILLILLEVPLAGYVVAPERTVGAVESFRSWLGRNGRRMAVYGAAGLGTLMLIRGVAGLIVG